MAKLRYGFIGTGMMARGHLDCVSALDGIELAAASDPSEESLAKFRERNPNRATAYYRDYRELLAKGKLDAVVIAAADFVHVDATIDSLAAGVHVLCEKPAGINRAELSRLEAAVAKAKTLYMVGLECRQMPIFRKVKELISAGAIGKPQVIWCKEFRCPFFPKVGQWMQFQDKTGGVFVTKTCHFFDLMYWFADSRPAKVNAVAGQDVVKDIYGVKPDVFDNGWVIVEFENQARGCLGLCMFDHSNPDLDFGIIGREGKIETFLNRNQIDLTQFSLSRNCPNEPSKECKNVKTSIVCEPTPEVAKLSHGGGVYYEHVDFLECVRTGREPRAGIDAAKFSALIGLAAEESARKSGAPVEI